MNRFLTLYAQRKAAATTEFKGRGARRVRCASCQMPQQNCFCEQAILQNSECGFALLMHNMEVLRPSNTGRFIADLIPDTHAFIWQRKEPCQGLLALCQQAHWQPYVVFPASFSQPERVHYQVELEPKRKPLFIMLDGSWREARKMFHQSPWLDQFPVISIQPEHASRYGLRSRPIKGQWATAEVAAQLLAMSGEESNAKLLEQRFNAFTQQTLAGRHH
ncbi:DTW domain-containing protein [Agarivorans sp. Toyoura001]|uniref:tRNA-uridine aminocarboxypropyltransferase n=1 Tax=Agarivorans sp. Toyoura001 TaxID=2283141 RepID=UPI0010EBEFCB|nr:DTW domain-containing protein [Agarivorans sp. Toyoura001]GDY25613.1 DTW domain-containing protein [Agarivorans sp. Toyoura001]